MIDLFFCFYFSQSIRVISKYAFGNWFDLKYEKTMQTLNLRNDLTLHVTTHTYRMIHKESIAQVRDN